MLRTRTWFAAMVVFGSAVSWHAAIALSLGKIDRRGGSDHRYLVSPGCDDGSPTSFYYGNPGDYPMVGTGTATAEHSGLVSPVRRLRVPAQFEHAGHRRCPVVFGNPGDVPLPGDFNKDGCDTVSIYRPSEARIVRERQAQRMTAVSVLADYAFYFFSGNRGDKAFTGDFNNNGQDTVGLHRESTGFVYYRGTLTTGIADNDFFYGDPGDQNLTGRWVQDPTKGPETVGIFRPSNGTLYLRFENCRTSDRTAREREHGGGCRLLRHTAGRSPAPPCGSLSGSGVPNFGDPGTGTVERDLEREAIPGAVRRDRPHPDDVWVRQLGSTGTSRPGRSALSSTQKATGRNTC